MNQCTDFCNNKYIKILKKYTKKKFPKGLALLNDKFIIDMTKDICKKELCNLKCKYSGSRKKKFEKLKQKFPVLSYCRTLPVFENNKNIKKL